MNGAGTLWVVMHKPKKKDPVYLKELLETGEVLPVFDKSYLLNEVAEALRYFGEGHFKGKTVITIDPNHKT